jgi:hypothetical protein
MVRGLPSQLTFFSQVEYWLCDSRYPLARTSRICWEWHWVGHKTVVGTRVLRRNCGIRHDLSMARADLPVNSHGVPKFTANNKTRHRTCSGTSSSHLLLFTFTACFPKISLKVILPSASCSVPSHTWFTLEQNEIQKLWYWLRLPVYLEPTRLHDGSSSRRRRRFRLISGLK